MGNNIWLAWYMREGPCAFFQIDGGAESQLGRLCGSSPSHPLHSRSSHTPCNSSSIYNWKEGKENNTAAQWWVKSRGSTWCISIKRGLCSTPLLLDQIATFYYSTSLSENYSARLSGEKQTVSQQDRMASLRHSPSKEPEIELFVKVSFWQSGCLFFFISGYKGQWATNRATYFSWIQQQFLGNFFILSEFVELSHVCNFQLWVLATWLEYSQSLQLSVSCSWLGNMSGMPRLGEFPLRIP